MLSGTLPDQAALQGVLLQIIRLGLTLLSLETSETSGGDARHNHTARYRSRSGTSQVGHDVTKKEEVSTMMRRIVATELFVQDLSRCATFYRDTLGLEWQEDGPGSAVFKIGDVYFFLLEVSAAADLISEGSLELKIEGGPRSMLAVEVEDVDATYEMLKAKGVTLLRPPTDQLWGLRTAHFADPEGNPWEIHQSIGSKTGK